MDINQLQAALLESIKDPILFADCQHMTRYMNKAAARHYEEGYDLLGKSLLTCHNEESNRQIIIILEKMKNGLEEELITDDESRRIYMRAVRAEDGTLLGYYERYEPKSGI